MHCPVLDPKEFFTDLGRVRWEHAVEVTTDHRPNDATFCGIRFSHRKGFDGSTIADDRDLVGNSANLLELVRDDDARNTLAAQAIDQVEQVRRVFVIEGSGRLIENQQFHLLR